jgi:hypothetical protein
MTRKTTFKHTLTRLRHAACAFGLLISLAVLPAYGQLVHQLSYNNSYWMDQKLNGVPSEIYPLAAFPTTPNDQSHVYYLSSGRSPHVHQLYYNGVSWADEDLTALSGGPIAFSTVTGFSVGNYQYVYYVSFDVPHHVHQLLYNNVNWVDSDLAALSGTPQQDAAFLGLVAFTTTPALHVYYVDGNSLGVHQLFSNDGTAWQDQDLTSLTGGPQLNFLACGFNIKNFQYVYFTDVNFDLHQLSYNNSTWSDTDLTVLTKTGVPVAQVAAFAIPGTKKMRVYFVSLSNGHLLQLASTNGAKWAVTDLTKKSKGRLPDPSTSIVAYATTPNDEVHVFYVSGSHVNQIYQSTATTWSNEDLTSSGNGEPVAEFSGLAGFSLQNEQYVFYQAQ